MRFSLVLCTVGRTDTLPAFLCSLARQTVPLSSIHLIVVDQNDDDRVTPLLAPYTPLFEITHIRCEKGLSRARNAAYAYIRGEIVGFPDDDCVYPDALLQVVDSHFTREPGMSVLIANKAPIELARFRATHLNGRLVPLTTGDIWKSGVCSITQFFRRGALFGTGRFDETLGLGSGTAWGSGEDIDLPWRAIRNGFSTLQCRTLDVYHPVYDPEDITDPAEQEKHVQRTLSYARGAGRVWRKNRLSPRLVLSGMTRPLGGALIARLQGKSFLAACRFASFRGRMSGYFAAADRSW